jgi:polysaccharide deacetylase family protein (PEP-CTERM system associated)
VRAQNALTIDVEDWFHDATRKNGPAEPGEIAAVGARVERNLRVLLDLLAESETRATLFFLGEVARAEPALIRRAQAEGHEIACHGDRHLPVTARSPRELLDDVRRARDSIAEIAGVAPRGFRAPCFLRGPEGLWALDVIAAAGFAYDSSYMPLRYSPGPVPSLGAGRGPTRLANGLWEFPLPLSRIATGHVLPCAAGGFALRALPYGFMERHLARFNHEVGPAVVYTHPWEIDPGSPKLPGTPAIVRFFNGIGRRKVESKLRRLLKAFRFAPLSEVFAEELASTGNGRPPVESPCAQSA